LNEALALEIEEAPITEDWLKEVGFRWHQLARQPERHWLLWLGDAVRGRNSMIDIEDLGVEVCSGASDDNWFCWLRSDLSCKYSRFIHLRYLKTQDDLISLIEGITGEKMPVSISRIDLSERFRPGFERQRGGTDHGNYQM
jgi:hypothetical protein